MAPSWKVFPGGTAKCVETLEAGGVRFVTEGTTYTVAERRRHPRALHDHYVVEVADDGKKHVFPATYFSTVSP